MSRTSRRDGRKSGSGRSGPDEDPHVDPLGQLGEEVAQDDWLARRGTSSKSGEKNQFVMWMVRAGGVSSRAIIGSASAPSIMISTALPGRGEAARWPSQFRQRRVRAPSRFGEGAGGGDARSGLRSPRRAGIQPTKRLRRRRIQIPSIAGVAQRIDRERDQSGGDDPEQIRAVRVIRQLRERAVEPDSPLLGL